MLNGHSLDDIFILNDCQNRRASSYDVSGGNHDWWDFEPGDNKTLMEVSGCGIIRHIWCTQLTKGPCQDDEEDVLATAKLVLRMYWDGEDTPSVEVPIGDFFGLGFGMRKNFASMAFSMGSEDGRAHNCFFPMPFRKGAKITLESQCSTHTNFYFYIDYEICRSLPEDAAYFHCTWHREEDTHGWAPREYGLLEREKANVEGEPDWLPAAWLKKNTDGADNYVILEAQGRGKYVGCVLNIDVFEPQCNEWYGEGDDMIFIDGEEWPPSLHGTGTEDYFNTAFGPTQEFCTPWHGLTLYSGKNDTPGYRFCGKNSMYRLHINDPIHFEKSIRVTIEHGHANKLSNDYSSTAFWYQSEPHKPFATLPTLEKRMPRTEKNNKDKTEI